MNNFFIKKYYTNNFEHNYDTYKKEIINYIKDNIGIDNKSLNNEIEKKVEEINKQINIYKLFNTIEK